MSRLPATIITAAKIAALPRATTRSPSGLPVTLVVPASVPPRSVAIVGSTTSTATVTRSSTITQPTAVRPWTVSSSFRSSSARSRTTVLAIEMASPSTSPPPTPQPIAAPNATPRSVTTAIRMIAPGTANARTAIRSSIEKWIPTPNISRITPISASSVAIALSAINPGVNGPITTPARM